MQKYLLHEAISEGCFNRNYCSASGSLAPWASELTNSPEVLDLLCRRMQSDYESTTPKMRRAFNLSAVESCYKHNYISNIDHVESGCQPNKHLEIFIACLVEESLQRRCGAFFECLQVFLSKYPSSFTEKEEPNITKALLGCVLVCHDGT